MTKFRVETTRRALADADEAFLWIYENAPEAALKWYDGLMDVLRTLSSDPKRCGLAVENPVFDKELRQVLYGNYRIVFTVEGRTVYVLRVRHSARKPLTPDKA